MPEGDTVRKLAAALAEDLRGAKVACLELRRLVAPSVAGRRVLDVNSKGKHLFVIFDNGLLLRSHLGLYGSWHRYASGESWSKPRRQASIVLEAEGRLFVCFNARDVELLRAAAHRVRDAVGRLGPDLTRDAPESYQIITRIRELLGPQTALVDLLLDQRVASGMGNVYKSEVLFLARQHPLRRLDETSAEVLAGLYRLAAELLRQNLGNACRRTRFIADGRAALWVYGRTKRPCLICSTPVRRQMLGSIPRVTYWCPNCQGQETEISDLSPSTPIWPP